MNVPIDVNIDAAVTLYYARHEIDTKDVMQIFNCGKSKAQQLKKAARGVQDFRGVASYNARAVNTEVAFEVWGLDIKRLERAQKHPKIRLGAGE